MPENDRNRSQNAERTTGDQNNPDQGDQRKNSSAEQGDDMGNPQRGSEWSNYRTRELSSNAEQTGGGEGNATTPGSE
ncbi:MAG TPA: hypothetical protein VNR87_03260 [Flavisolibacter sp.]|nr:hypothetical protein [Flavisolibacter sp.]